MNLVKSKIGLSKKALIMLMAVFVLTLGFSQVFPGLIGVDTAEATSLKSQINSNSTTTLTTSVDTAGANIIKLAKDIALVVLFILIIWMGYSVWFKKTAEGLADMKGRLIGLLIAIAFVFMPEKILGALFKLFGITLT
jgi:hypothetical protein